MGTPRYTAEEQRQILYHVERGGKLDTIALRLGRSPVALRKHLAGAHGWTGAQSRRARWIAVTGGMSCPAVARLLGVSRSVVKRWAQRGYLRANRARGLKLTQRIDPIDLIAFLEKGYALLAKPIDPFWRDIVADIRADFQAQYISTPELAGLLMMAPEAIRCMTRRRQFPPLALRMPGALPSYYERSAIRAWLDAHPRYWTRQAWERL